MNHSAARCPCLALFLVLLLFPLAGLAAEADPVPERPPVTVQVAKVRRERIPALIEVTGTIQAAQRAAISAKISGVITRMPVVLGSTVKAGDLLASLSAEEITARVNQAEAQLAQALRNLEREQNLLSKNAATPDSVKTLREQYTMAQAGLREARSMLAYATLNAPFDGVITAKLASQGDLATPGTILLELENPRRLQVRTAVPESLVLAIRTGDQLFVRVETAGIETKGTVSEIAPAADPQSRTAQVTLDLPEQEALRSGQFARVRVPGREETTLVVPAGAVVPLGQMDRVFVVEDGRARLRLVRTGWREHGATEILSGLGGDETVVTSNNTQLVDGQSLKVTQ